MVQANLHSWLITSPLPAHQETLYHYFCFDLQAQVAAALEAFKLGALHDGLAELSGLLAGKVMLVEASVSDERAARDEHERVAEAAVSAREGRLVEMKAEVGSRAFCLQSSG